MDDEFSNLPMPPLDEAFFSDLNFDNIDDIDFNLDDFTLFDDDFLNLSSPDDPIRVSDFPSPAPTSSHGSDNENSENLQNSANSPNLKKMEKFGDFSENSANLRKVENLGDLVNFSENSANSDNLRNIKNFESLADLGNFSENSANSDNLRNIRNLGDLGNFSENSAGFDNLRKIGNLGDLGNSVSPVSENSGNFENLKNSPDFSENITNMVADQKVQSTNLGNMGIEEKVKSEEESNNSALKRKKNSDLESRTSKCKKPNVEGDGSSDLDDKKMARLVRNRESAQLSRQRKKHYIEELEDRVRMMQSTIQDLNSRITYLMAENASLRMQASGVPPPGMYPPPPMGYPWVPYMVKQQGSQVPLVPIPRLKPQQPKPAPKVKKSGSKTKKVASVSFLGLLFFMLLFGGFVPMVNLKFKEMNDTALAGSGYFNSGVFSNRQSGRTLTSLNGSDRDGGIGKDYTGIGHCGKGGTLDGDKGCGNSSEPLVASLYVPRNDKLVKIDGNLIIHSIMASEKAMASSKDEIKKREETALALAHPSIIPLTGRNRHPHPYRGSVERQRALGGEKDKMMSSPADGNLQQWFMEGLAGPMLSSGMCTEVFQFDVSPAAGAIVPAASVMNATSGPQHPKNVTTNVKGRNRRILHSPQVPLGGSESNITKRPVGIEPGENKLQGNNSLSSMVVSVLVDPREAGDGVGDGVMGRKSLSRIFVVVLIDSVKYVTYSCMMPQVGSGTHLTT